MKCGIVMPYPSARDAVEFAAIAEEHGWDGFFVWESVWGIDAWVSLGAAAVRTETIQRGTMLSPLSRMRPWMVASEYVTLDQLSGGRAILVVGLGAADTGFAEFGEETNMKVRAELMDEALDIITGLFDGQPFEYVGKHHKVESTQFFPPPNPINQTIWVVGLLGSNRSMSRVVKFQGLLPSVRDGNGKLNSTDVMRITTSWLRERHQEMTARRRRKKCGSGRMQALLGGWNRCGRSRMNQVGVICSRSGSSKDRPPSPCRV